MNPIELDQLLRPLQQKDLRALCRARGMNPGGSKAELTEMLKEHMMATGNYSMVIPAADGGDGGGYGGGGHGGGGGDMYSSPPPGQYGGGATGVNNNNYSRPGGQQNVGNFITDKPSSRVLAPPGGSSSIQLGGYGGDAGPSYGSPARQYGGAPGSSSAARARSRESPAAPGGLYGTDAPTASYTYGGTPPPGQYGGGASGVNNNNYSRPGGQQNVGNFITDKPSSRVLAPPGGGSSIQFGNYVPPHQARGSPQQHGYQQHTPPPLPPTHPGSAGGYAGFAGMGASPYNGGGGGGGGAGAGYGAQPGPGYGNAPLGGGAIPIPMGYDANFAPVGDGQYGTIGAAPQHRVPSAGRRAGKPQPMGGGVRGLIEESQYPDPGAVGVGRGNDGRTNNYSRPGGQQNVGNFITDRPSSRVLAPPGGRSQISFG